MDYVREGDTVVVWKLDRLGRNLMHILETVKWLTDRGVTLVSSSDGIDSRTAAGRMMIDVLGSLAEYERELAKERTALQREMSEPTPRKAAIGAVCDATGVCTESRCMQTMLSWLFYRRVKGDAA